MSRQQSRTDGLIEERVTAERDGDFVVFHIGMRINAFWKLHRWLPILFVAPRMIRELVGDPASGLLGSRTVVGPGIRHIGFVQYWESFDDLSAYARDGDGLHYPAWLDYYRDGGDAGAAVGIWHETFLVRSGEYETVYNNTPPHGLGACRTTETVPATDRRKTATGRLGGRDGPASPVDAK